MASAVVPMGNPPGTSSSVTQAAPAALPEHRAEAFRHAVAARLRAGADVVTLRREQLALIGALTDDKLLNIMAAAFSDEMKNQMPSATDLLKPQEALDLLNEVLLNRKLDARNYVALLSDPAFVASAQQEAQQPAPAATTFTLSKEKSETIVNRLVQPDHPQGPEPMIHVLGPAIGHRMVHQALADMFKQETVKAEMLKSLARQAPNMQAGALDAFGDSWLNDRHNAAHEVAKGLASSGTLYQDAMTQAHTLHTQKITAALQPPPIIPLAPMKVDAPALAPVPQVVVPTQPAQKLAVQSSIAMEV